MHRLQQYISDVENGKILAGRYVKLAIKRFKEDLLRDDLDFIPDRAQRVIDFISLLKHTKGQHNNKSFILSDWQVFIIANIYGFYKKSNGRRKYRRVYIEMARKQGKTAFVAALALYHLIADGESGAEVIFAANSRDQASYSFTLTREFVQKLDPKKKYFKNYRSSITYEPTHSVIKVISADSTKQDGFNASFGIVDEYHAAKDSKLYDVIASSMTAREQPILATITTAGDNKSSPCYDYRNTCIGVLEGNTIEDSLFSIIYTIDEDDDWKDSKVWAKSNPNLDITVELEAIKEEVIHAINQPSAETGVKIKTLNIWTDTVNVWIPSELMQELSKDLDWKDFEGLPVYIGVDLAQTRDLTAVAYCWEKNKRLNFKVNYYLPRGQLNVNSNKYKYNDWYRNKLLTLTNTNVTDYNKITSDITKHKKIRTIYYDPYNAEQWALDMTANRFPIEPFSQTIGNFNRYTKELERLIFQKEIIIDNSEITRWCFNNATLKEDHNENIKPIKGGSRLGKIDGVIAIIQALAAYMQDNSRPKIKIY